MVAITVTDVNLPPVLDSIASPQTVNEAETLVINISASDFDGTIPILTAANLPTNSGFIDNGDGTGQFTFTPDYFQAGIYDVLFAAADTQFTDSQWVQIIVVNVNRPVTLDSITTPISMNEGDTIQFLVTASDPDGAPSLFVDAPPLNSAFIDSGDGVGLFRFTPSYYQSGNYSVLFFASDGESADSQYVAIEVADVNLPPSIISPGAQIIYEGDTLRLLIVATDIDDDPPMLSAIELPPTATFFDSGNGSGLLYFAPGYFDAGFYTATIVASDSVLADTEIIEITVINRNRAPVWNPIPPRSVMEGTILTFNVSAYDPDLVIPTLSVANLPANAVFIDSTNGSGHFRFAPDFTQSGIYDLLFLASDGGLIDTEIVSITVFDAGNQRPVIDSIGPRAVVEGQQLEINVVSHDPDLTIPILSAVNIPANSTFESHGDGTGRFVFNPSFAQAGVYYVSFIASDGVLADTEIVEITVLNLNRPPVLGDIGSRSVIEGDSLVFTLIASDPDNDSLYFTGTNLPPNASVINLNRTSGQFRFFPDFTQSGVYNVGVFVSDGAARDSEIVTITVLEAGNQAPTILNIDSTFTILPGDSLAIIISAIDPDGDSLSFTSGSAIPFNAGLVQLTRYTALFYFRPTLGQVGDYVINVIVSDPGYSVSKNFYVSVISSGNRPPVFVAIPPQSVYEGDSIRFTVTATDPDGSTPPTLVLANPIPRSQFTDNGDGSGIFQYRPNYYDSGLDTLIFIATDELGLRSSLLVLLTTVEFNIAPTLYYRGDTIVFEGDTLRGTVFAYDSTDGSGGPLYISAIYLPTGASFTDNHDRTGSFVFVPPYSTATQDSAVFRVFDLGSPPLEGRTTARFVILNLNRPPAMAPLSAYEIDQAETLTVALSATDPDGDSVSFSLYDYPPPPRNSVVLNNGGNSGTFRFAPDYTQAGIFIVNIKAFDGIDSDVKAAYIYVQDLGNQTPTLYAFDDTSIVEGESLQVLILSTDPDSTICQLFVDNAPAHSSLVSLGNGTALFRFTPFFNQAGVYPMLFRAVDPSGAADSHAVTVTVIEAGNQRPALVPLTTVRTVNEMATLTFPVYGTDADSTIPHLTALNLPANAAFTDSGNGHGLFTFSPNNFQAGSYSVIFKVIDAEDADLADSQFVTIIVNNVNQIPTIDSIGPFTINEGDTLQFVVQGRDLDLVPPRLIQVNALQNSSFVDSGNGAGLFTFRPSYTQSGIRTVTFRAIDREDTLIFTNRSVTITVVNVNRPPVLGPIPLDTTIVDGTILTYTITATDPDLNTPSLAVRVLPPQATFVDNRNGTGTFQFTPGLAQIGTHFVTFLARDSLNTAILDSEVVRIVVVSSGMHPPQFAAAPSQYNAAPDSLLTIPFQATDPDGNRIIFSYLGTLPQGAVFADSGNGRGSFTWTPTVDQAGTYNLTFIAADTTGLSDSMQVQINVITFIRGDANADGQLRGSDVIYLVAFFKGVNPPPNPLARGDANADGFVGGADVTYLVRYFKGLGPPPPPLLIGSEPRQIKLGNAYSNGGN